jgi:hypothetical protein
MSHAESCSWTETHRALVGLTVRTVSGSQWIRGWLVPTVDRVITREKSQQSYQESNPRCRVQNINLVNYSHDIFILVIPLTKINTLRSLVMLVISFPNVCYFPALNILVQEISNTTEILVTFDDKVSHPKNLPSFLDMHVAFPNM